MTRTLLRWLAALAIGSLGGFLADLAGLPLPWLLGAQSALCIAALSGVTIAGGPLEWPMATRLIFLPVIGVVIGAAYTTDVLAQMPGWWPILVVISIFLLVLQIVLFAVFLRFGEFDRPTAFFAAFPGGFVEAALLGKQAGGDERLITLQQFLRITLIVLTIPLIFWAISGARVGSAAGDFIGGAEIVGLKSAGILFLAGVSGTILGRALRLPAPDIFGAVVASAAVHLMGWVNGHIPALLINLAQLVIGISLGVGFVGISTRQFRRAAGLAISAFAVSIGLAVFIGWAASGLTGVDIRTTVLAFAPGGLAEMSLVALSMGLSVPLVTCVHLYRIFFTVLIIPRLYPILSICVFPSSGRDAERMESDR